MSKVKGQIIRKIRESPSEKEVMGAYREYFAEIESEIEKPQVKNKPAKIKKVIEVAKEAARRVSNPDERDLLARCVQKFDEAEIVILPCYEENFVGNRKWMMKDVRRFEQYIRAICRAITELADERIDDKFTMYDLYRRVPESSFLLESFLGELEKLGFIVFEYFVLEKAGEKVESEMIRLQPKWFSARDITGKVMKKLTISGEIPYSAVQKSHYVEW